ncbi:MAG: protein translocase SecG subunit, partial [Planctomycetota bacterium]
LFVISAFVLVVVILLQEGKGGGFGDALGTAGQQTFGVKAAGIHKFTAAVGGVFLVSAIGIHIINRLQSETVVGTTTEQPAPADAGN